VQQKSKEQKMAAAMAGGKGKKKKWSKNKSRDKILNEVQFKETTYERMMSEVPKVSCSLSVFFRCGLCSRQSVTADTVEETCRHAVQMSITVLYRTHQFTGSRSSAQS
jgi:ribosomal protein S25